MNPGAHPWRRGTAQTSGSVLPSGRFLYTLILHTNSESNFPEVNVSYDGHFTLLMGIYFRFLSTAGYEVSVASLFYGINNNCVIIMVDERS